MVTRQLDVYVTNHFISAKAPPNSSFTMISHLREIAGPARSSGRFCDVGFHEAADEGCRWTAAHWVLGRIAFFIYWRCLTTGLQLLKPLIMFPLSTLTSDDEKRRWTPSTTSWHQRCETTRPSSTNLCSCNGSNLKRMTVVREMWRHRHRCDVDVFTFLEGIEFFTKSLQISRL